LVRIEFAIKGFVGSKLEVYKRASGLWRDGKNPRAKRKLNGKDKLNEGYEEMDKTGMIAQNIEKQSTRERDGRLNVFFFQSSMGRVFTRMDDIAVGFC
jgi:hypothetical protein